MYTQNKAAKNLLYRTKAREAINYNVNDVLNKHKDGPSEPTITVPTKDVILVLPYLGLHDVLNKHKDRPSEPTHTVPKKDVLLVLPYLGLHSDAITRRLKSCVNKFYDFVNLSVISQNTRRI